MIPVMRPFIAFPEARDSREGIVLASQSPTRLPSPRYSSDKPF
jgi:hypothetical protein